MSIGAHILDVLVRPVSGIPEGQGAELVEEIRLAPAGAAGGTAVTLAKLGAEVYAVGAIGVDRLGDVLLEMLAERGVDTGHLERREDLQTSSSVIPIRPNGDRPALHVIGANMSYSAAELPHHLIAEAELVHVGGPELLGETAAQALAEAKDGGAVTTMDLLADGWPELLDMIAPALPHADCFTPNDEQVRLLTGEADAADGARVLLARGAPCVVVTCGAAGALIVTPDGETRVPAFEVEAVDTSGCGDAFTAGLGCALALGHPVEQAARVGAAAASRVATGTGSDHGEFTLNDVLAQAQVEHG